MMNDTLKKICDKLLLILFNILERNIHKNNKFGLYKEERGIGIKIYLGDITYFGNLKFEANLF